MAQLDPAKYQKLSESGPSEISLTISSGKLDPDKYKRLAEAETPTEPVDTGRWITGSSGKERETTPSRGRFVTKGLTTQWEPAIPQVQRDINTRPDRQMYGGVSELFDRGREAISTSAANTFPEWLAPGMARLGSMALEPSRIALETFQDPEAVVGGWLGKLRPNVSQANRGIEKAFSTWNVENVQPNIPKPKALPPGKFFVSPKGKVGNAVNKYDAPVLPETPSMRESLGGRLPGEGRRYPDINVKPSKVETVNKDEPSLSDYTAAYKTIIKYLDNDGRKAAEITKNMTPQQMMDYADAIAPRISQTAIPINRNTATSVTIGGKNATVSEAQQFIEATKSGLIPKGTTFDQFKQQMGRLLKEEDIPITSTTTAKGLPPNQRALMYRGKNDRVTIEFTDSESRDIFGAGQSSFKAGEARPEILQRFASASSRIAQRFGLDPQIARRAIIKYNEEVRNLGNAQPKVGDELKVSPPSFSEFIKRFIKEEEGSVRLPKGLEDESFVPEEDQTLGGLYTGKPRPGMSQFLKGVNQRVTGNVRQSTAKEETSELERLFRDETGSIRLPKIDSKKKLPGNIDQNTYNAIRSSLVSQLRSGKPLNLNAILQSTKGVTNKQFNAVIDDIMGQTGQIEQQIRKVEAAPFNAPVNQLFEAIKANQPRRAAQEAIYSAERGNRFSEFMKVRTKGEAGFRERASKLSGEYQKVGSAPLNLPQEQKDQLFDIITSSKGISPAEQLRAGIALGKLLRGGNVPQTNELQVLDKVFGQNFSNQIIEMHGGLGAVAGDTSKLAKTMGKYFLDYPGKVYDLTRGMMSVDFPFTTSAAFRQGAPLAGTRQWAKAYVNSVKSYGNSQTYDNVMDIINNNIIHQNRPFVIDGETHIMSIADRIGLAKTNLETIGKGGEKIRSALAEQIPLFGRHVKASNRSFVAFLNTLRTKTAEDWLKAGGAIDDAGNIVDFEKAQRIAYTINELTGYGSLKIGAPLTRFRKAGPIEKDLDSAANALSYVFFSPRLLARDARMMNPLNYMKNDKLERVKYLQGAIRRAAVWSSFTGIAALLGAEVGTDPTSADFGKAKIGDSRLDAGTGLLQWLTLIGRNVLGEYTSSVSGNTTELGSEYGAPTRGDIGVQFLANRLHPTLSYGVEAKFASKYRPFFPASEAMERMTPLFTGDLIELAKSDPEAVQIFLGLVASGAAMGMTTYGDRPEESMLEPLDIEEPAFEGGRLFGR